MSVIAKPYTFSANTTISSSQVNSNFDTLYNDYNGGIAAANLASNSVTTAKIADSNVTTAKIADSNVTTAKIATDAITATKIDWASTGADGGIWWEEIGRTTLGSAGDTIAVSSFAARNYLMIIFKGTATGGTLDASFTFNSDSGANYAWRGNNNGTLTTGVSASAMPLEAGTVASGGTERCQISINNTTSQEKMMEITTCSVVTAGAGTAPNQFAVVGKWVNTSAQVTTISFANAGTGDFAIGSEIVVLGHN